MQFGDYDDHCGCINYASANTPSISYDRHLMDFLHDHCVMILGLFFFSAEHDIFGEVSSSDDEVNILDGVQQAAGPSGFCADDVKDSVDLGFAEAAATLDSDVCESLKHSH